MIFRFAFITSFAQEGRLRLNMFGKMNWLSQMKIVKTIFFMNAQIKLARAAMFSSKLIANMTNTAFGHQFWVMFGFIDARFRDGWSMFHFFYFKFWLWTIRCVAIVRSFFNFSYCNAFFDRFVSFRQVVFNGPGIRYKIPILKCTISPDKSKTLCQNAYGMKMQIFSCTGQWIVWHNFEQYGAPQRLHTRPASLPQFVQTLRWL